jgi:hypothetical protein
MAIKLAGPWSKPQIDEFLENAHIPIRLSCLAADGFPRVISLWYQYITGTLYCVTNQSSKLAHLLEKNNCVGFEISADSPPYHGVRGQGIAKLQPLGSDSTLEQLLIRYIGDLESDFSRWLLSRRDQEILIMIEPRRLFSWDYSKRMAAVV